jgi:hypothetical protein
MRASTNTRIRRVATPRAPLADSCHPMASLRSPTSHFSMRERKSSYIIILYGAASAPAGASTSQSLNSRADPSGIRTRWSSSIIGLSRRLSFSTHSCTPGLINSRDDARLASSSDIRVVRIEPGFLLAGLRKTRRAALAGRTFGGPAHKRLAQGPKVPTLPPFRASLCLATRHETVWPEGRVTACPLRPSFRGDPGFCRVSPLNCFRALTFKARYAEILCEPCYRKVTELLQLDGDAVRVPHHRGPSSGNCAPP